MMIIMMMMMMIMLFMLIMKMMMMMMIYYHLYLQPCGACNEWLKKIAEVNPHFKGKLSLSASTSPSTLPQPSSSS